MRYLITVMRKLDENNKNKMKNKETFRENPQRANCDLRVGSKGGFDDVYMKQPFAFGGVTLP